MSFHFAEVIADLQRPLRESAVSQIRDSRKTDSYWILTRLASTRDFGRVRYPGFFLQILFHFITWIFSHMHHTSMASGATALSECSSLNDTTVSLQHVSATAAILRA